MGLNRDLIDRLLAFRGQSVQMTDASGAPFGPPVDKCFIIAMIRSGGAVDEPAQDWLQVRSGIGFLRRIQRDHGHILVFNSNLMGLHSSGTALTAKRWYSAQEGIGEGLTGSAYALPTKEGLSRARPQYAVTASVHRFLGVAAERSDLMFKVTRLGCTDARMASTGEFAALFLSAPPNCGFDPEWSRFGLRSWTEAGILDAEPLSALEASPEPRPLKAAKNLLKRGYRRERTVRIIPPRGLNAPA